MLVRDKEKEQEAPCKEGWGDLVIQKEMVERKMLKVQEREQPRKQDPARGQKPYGASVRTWAGSRKTKEEL